MKGCIESGGFCEFDVKRKILCNCKDKIWGTKQSICLDVCVEEKNKKNCDDKSAICMEDSSTPEGYRCECETGKKFDDGGNCVGVCVETKNKKICDYKSAICMEDSSTPEGYRCECETGKTFDDGGNCVGVCVDKINRMVCDDKSAICKEDSSKPDGYKCECKTGKTLDDDGNCVDVCEEKKNNCDDKYAICKEDSSKPDGYRCECETGKAFDDDGNCVEDPCYPNPCENGGTCTRINDSYNCTCTDRFGGDNCNEKNLCLDAEQKMCGDVKCRYDTFLGKATCVCGTGKEFVGSSKTCVDVDKCFQKILDDECSKPHETCQNGKCFCEENYKYSEDRETCEPNFCSAATKPCPSNSDCIELRSGNVLCVCKERFYQEGRYCRRIDLCSPGMSKCQQKCNSANGKCDCYEGFTLDDDNKTCTKTEQASDCSLDCGEYGTCVIEKGVSKCICPPVTHNLVGESCIDKCTHRNFTAPDHMCPTKKCEEDSDHVFRCKCTDPYELDEDGIHCKRKAMCEDEKVIEECANMSAVCEELKDGKGYRCVCEKGFDWEKGVCIRKCDIKVNQDKCARLRATCELNANYDPVCKCPPLLEKGKEGLCNVIASNSFMGTLSVLKTKYQLIETIYMVGKSTYSEIDLPKLNNDMEESMKEIYGKKTELKVLQCNLDDNIVACNLELQPEKKDVNIIKSPSICLPLNDDYCLLKPNLIMKRGEEGDVFQKTDPCDMKVKMKLCGNSTDCSVKDNNDFQCTCKKGFYTIGTYHLDPSRDNTFIQKCDDINECSKSESPCPKSTKCINMYGDYDCICKDGFKKKNASSNPKKDGCDVLCEPNPCKHGACVKVGNHGFSCKCTEGYTGILCNETAEISSTCTKNPCLNGGTCFVEGNAFRCSCVSPYTGDVCDSNTGNMKMAIWILGTIVAILIVTIGIILCRINQRRLGGGSSNKC